MASETLKRKEPKEDLPGITKRVIIGEQKVYFLLKENTDGSFSSIDIWLAKMGGKLRVYECLATAITLACQHGVPLGVFMDEFRHQKMEPAGFTDDPGLPSAASIVDFLAQWLSTRYNNNGTRRTNAQKNITTANPVMVESDHTFADDES